jgi:CHAT domain-containing protein
MVTYYGGLKQGLGRGDALRQAQLAMLRDPDTRHPFYWASFIQAGDWTPVARPH